MREQIQRISNVNKNELSQEFYFQSLLEQGAAKGILSDQDIERIQLDCLNLLAYKTERFNMGDSSSIPIEKAQNIMNSNLFTIGVWLKTYEYADDALEAVMKESISEIYEKGAKRIDLMVKSSKAVYGKLLERLIDTENICYRETIIGGISGFFKLYSPVFSAQEIHITADYPVYNFMPKQNGIEFIQAYVEALYFENQFCLNFTSETIHRLLIGYEKNYKDLIINIYGIVLEAAVVCVISGGDLNNLDIPPEKVDKVSKYFSERSREGIFQSIYEAFSELCRIFQFSEGVKGYGEKSLSLIAGKIDAYIKEGMIGTLFIKPAYDEKEPKVKFSFGDKMENDKYAEVISEIMQCRFPSDKIAIIKNEINSLGDLEDMMVDALLTGAEIKMVFNIMGLPEIAALSKKYLYEYSDVTELREQEELLRTCLAEFIQELPEKEQDLILKLKSVME